MPSGFCTALWAPSHSVWRPPLAKLQVPLSAIAAVDPDRLAVAVARAPGEADVRAPNTSSGIVRHGGGGGRGRDVRLVDEPGDAGIGPSQRLAGLGVFEQMDLLAAEALGQQEPQHVLAHQRVDHLRRHLAAAVHFGAVLVEQRLQGARPFRRAGGDRRLYARIHSAALGMMPRPHTGRLLRGVNACRKRIARAAKTGFTGVCEPKGRTMLNTRLTTMLLAAAALLGACVPNTPPTYTGGPPDPNSQTTFTLALAPGAF